ncbi:MAG: peptide chain release factor N(5)-glutamine methyltransferase [Bacteroidetes bacterium]|nr:peptide chain release factor N(5)-glutamine methyltransferase [Bacteroidota bacterium]
MKSMHVSSVSLRQMREHYRRSLVSLYETEEINNIFNLLVEEYLGLSRALMILSLDQDLRPPVSGLFERALNDLINARPVQYIIGKTMFCGRSFMVSEGVLIPRPETGEMVEWIVESYSDVKKELSVIDIGTGSGCIAITLSGRSNHMKVYALDVSLNALDTARKNAYANDVDVVFLHADILKPSSWKDCGLFDIIVSNPPYVRRSEKQHMKRNVLDFEPHEALFVPDDDPLVFYRHILNFAGFHLAPQGKIYLEFNEAMVSEMIELTQKQGLILEEIRKDIHGKDRMARIRKS